MSAQPFASIAAIVVAAILGFAVWFGLAGGRNIGDPNSAPTPVPGAVETEQFADPFSLVPPDDWVIIESPNSVVVQSPLVESIVVFRTEGASIWGGLDDGYMPWPNDLVAWLEDYPVVTDAAGPGSLAVNLAGETDATVGGVAAQVIDARYNFFADPRFDGTMTLISLDPANAGSDALVFGGGGYSFPVQFVVLRERGIIIYHETQSSSSLAEFGAFLDSIRFTDG